MTTHAETKFREGEECSICHTTLKYDNEWSSCFHCTNKRNKLRHKRYAGNPCKKCKGTEYFNDGSCVQCLAKNKIFGMVKKKKTLAEDINEITHIKGWQYGAGRY